MCQTHWQCVRHPDRSIDGGTTVKVFPKSCPTWPRIRNSVRKTVRLVYETSVVQSSGPSGRKQPPPPLVPRPTSSAPPHEPGAAPRGPARAHTLCPPSRRSHDGTRLNVPLILRLARRACPHSTLFGRTPCAVTQRGSTPRHRTIDRHPQSASSIEKSMSHTTTYFMRICLVS